jgi:hypothetical protein
MPMPYAPAELVAALTATSRRWAFRYERVQPSGVATPLTVTSASVAYNDLADLQRTCNVQMPQGTGFATLADRFRPYVSLLMADGFWQEWLVGTFLLSSDARRYATAAGEGLVGLTGWDVATKTLEDDKVEDRYVVAAGTNVLTAVRTVVSGAGLSLDAMPTAAVTLTTALEWDPGTPKRKIVNDLLGAVNYRPITGTVEGLPTTTPYLDPQTAPVVWDYKIVGQNVVRPGVDVALDLFDVPNRWVGFVSVPDAAPMRSVFTNVTPADPLSTVGRGRTIVKVVNPQGTQAVDQATLDALVRRAAQEDRSQFEEASFTTGLMPFHGGGDVVTLDTGSGAVRYRSHTWDLELRAGGAMKHTVRRVVTL